MYGGMLRVPDGARCTEQRWAREGDLKVESFCSTVPALRQYKELIARQGLDGETAQAFDIDSEFMATRRWEYGYAMDSLWRYYNQVPGDGLLRVLDVGCGYRPFTLFLVGRVLELTGRPYPVPMGCSRGLEVWAVDNESWAKKEPLAERLGAAGVHYKKGEMTALPFEDQFFDAVFAISVFEHLLRDEIQPALNECVRVLRPATTVDPGGLLVATVDTCSKVKLLTPADDPPADAIYTAGGRAVAGSLFVRGAAA